ncbi:hypothetical protein D3C73_1416130 [compost metagenome]
MRHHNPGDPRRFQLGDQLGQTACCSRTFGLKLRNRLPVYIKRNNPVSMVQQIPAQIGTHFS